MTRAFVHALGVALLAASGALAEARVWRVDPEMSVISFDYELNGRPATGRFTRVAGEGAFDPQDVGAARLRLEIDVSSLDLGDPVETAFAQSAEWFAVADHPTAVYRLARLTQAGEGAYEALGDLTIKNRLQVIRTPITLRYEGDTAFAAGSLTFDRRDFNVGVGASALFVSLGTEVSVRFDIVAHAEP